MLVMKKIYEALRKASIDEDIRKLEHGLDTRVSDLGDNFSGGRGRGSAWQGAFDR